MLSVLMQGPQYVWFACMLQLSETTVPFANLASLFERSHLIGRRPKTYRLIRSLLALVWIVFRWLVFGFFGKSVHQHWIHLTPLGKLLGVGSLIVLLPFNIVSFFIVCTPGFPWGSQASAIAQQKSASGIAATRNDERGNGAVGESEVGDDELTSAQPSKPSRGSGKEKSKGGFIRRRFSRTLQSNGD